MGDRRDGWNNHETLEKLILPEVTANSPLAAQSRLMARPRHGLSVWKKRTGVRSPCRSV
jgi:hypothetical protein